MTDLFISYTKTAPLPEADYSLKLVIRHAVAATLSHLGFPYPAEISVTLCDNEYIHTLNNRFRGVDRHTDVLSFPIYEADELDSAYIGEPLSLGDIVISLERAREQAGEVGNDFPTEVAFLAVHSTLHLLGYDHERSPEEDELQCRLQREIIEQLEI